MRETPSTRKPPAKAQNRTVDLPSWLPLQELQQAGDARKEWKGYSGNA